MKQVYYEIEQNQEIADHVFRMLLFGDTSAVTTPGQFVNIRLESRFLRRPISVCDCTDQKLTLIYKVVGQGTEQLSHVPAGSKLDLLTGLGNGYDCSLSGPAPLLIGGGAGVPPLYWLCRKLLEQGKDPTVILGFNTAAEVFYEEEFRALGAQVLVATVDGSCGEQGFVTDVMLKLEQQRMKAKRLSPEYQTVQTGDFAPADAPFYSYFYTCGPMPMFRAIQEVAQTSGQFSFEERMGCGFGACMGCSCKTLTGSKRICVDGPVLQREEIIW